MSGYYQNVMYPWEQEFEDYYAALKAVGAHVPAQFQGAYNALISVGQSIQSQIDGGTTIQADIPTNFISNVRRFADHLKTVYAPAASIDQMKYAEPQDSGVFGNLGTTINETFGGPDPYSQSVIGAAPPMDVWEIALAGAGFLLLAAWFLRGKE